MTLRAHVHREDPLEEVVTLFPVPGDSGVSDEVAHVSRMSGSPLKLARLIALVGGVSVGHVGQR